MCFHEGRMAVWKNKGKPVTLYKPMNPVVLAIPRHEALDRVRGIRYEKRG